MFTLTQPIMKKLKKHDFLVIQQKDGHYIKFIDTKKDNEILLSIITGEFMDNNKYTYTQERNICCISQNSYHQKSVLSFLKTNDRITFRFRKNEKLNNLLENDGYITETVYIIIRRNTKYYEFELSTQIIKSDTFDSVKMINYNCSF